MPQDATSQSGHCLSDRRSIAAGARGKNSVYTTSQVTANDVQDLFYQRTLILAGKLSMIDVA